MSWTTLRLLALFFGRRYGDSYKYVIQVAEDFRRKFSGVS